jgi:predicted HD phosphohydrolase
MPVYVTHPDSQAIQFAVDRLMKAIDELKRKIEMYKGYEEGAISRRAWDEAAKYNNLRYGIMSAEQTLLDEVVETKRLAFHTHVES